MCGAPIESESSLRQLHGSLRVDHSLTLAVVTVTEMLNVACRRTTIVSTG